MSDCHVQSSSVAAQCRWWHSSASFLLERRSCYCCCYMTSFHEAPLLKPFEEIIVSCYNWKNWTEEACEWGGEICDLNDALLLLQNSMAQMILLALHSQFKGMSIIYLSLLGVLPCHDPNLMLIARASAHCHCIFCLCHETRHASRVSCPIKTRWRWFSAFAYNSNK